MLCGYTIARHPRQQQTFFLVIATIYWLFCMPDLAGFISSTRGGLDGSMQQIQVQGLEGTINAREQAQACLSCFIYFAPLLLFFAIALFRIYSMVARRTLYYVIVIQITFLATAILLGFGAGVLLSVTSLVLFGNFAPVRSFGYRVGWLAISAAGD
jgi:hypothetical protein